jgi:hypothetical protein
MGEDETVLTLAFMRRIVNGSTNLTSLGPGDSTPGSSVPKLTSLEEGATVSYQCETCGREHVGLPMDVASAKPGDYFTIPAGERDRRCFLTSDVCVIDKSRFYLRGVLYVRVVDAEQPFGWGLWAEVSEQSFKRYRALYSADGTEEPPFRGQLSVEDRPGYEKLDGHTVMIQMRTAAERPTFAMAPSEHLLYREQHNGISLHRVHEILKRLFPKEFA